MRKLSIFVVKPIEITFSVKNCTTTFTEVEVDYCDFHNSAESHLQAL